MNEEAIKYAHELFVKDGYSHGLNDFKALIKSDPEALQYAYQLFEKDGFKDGRQAFDSLMGVSSNELKKKGSSQPSGQESTEPQEQPTTPSAKPTPKAPLPSTPNELLYTGALGGLKRNEPIAGVGKPLKQKQEPIDVTYTPEEMPSETTQGVVPVATRRQIQEAESAEKDIEKGQLPANEKFVNEGTAAKVEKQREKLGMNTLEEAAGQTLERLREDNIKETFSDVSDEVDDYIKNSPNNSSLFTTMDYDLGSGKAKWKGFPGLGGKPEEIKQGESLMESQAKRGEVLKVTMDDYFGYLDKTNPSQAEYYRNKYNVIKSSKDRDNNDEKFLQEIEGRALKLRAAAIKKDLDVYKTALDQYSQIEKRVNFQGFDNDVKELKQSAKTLNNLYQSGKISEDDYKVRFNQIQQGFERARIKNGFTPEVEEKLDQAKSIYFGYGQQAMKLSSIFGFMDQNSKEYRQYNQLQKDIEEAKKQREDAWNSASWFEKMYMAPGEFARTFSGGVGNMVLDILQAPKVLEEFVTGDTNYNFLDEWYDGIENLQLEKSKQFGETDSNSIVQYLTSLGGNAISSISVFALGGSLGGASKMAKFGSTFTTAFLAAEAGAYEEAMSTYKMSPRQAASAATAVATATALVEGLIPDIKYFEPGPYRASILRAISEGKTVSQAAREALPESAKAYFKTGIKEGGEEIAGQLSEDVTKSAVNLIGQSEYYKDLWKAKSYRDSFLGGFIGGTVMNVFQRPVGASPISEDIMLTAAENADAIMSQNTNEKINSELKSRITDARKDFQSLQVHPNWSSLNRTKQAHVFGITQQIRTLESSEIKDPIINAQINKLKSEREEILSLGTNGIDSRSVGTSTMPQRVMIGGKSTPKQTREIEVLNQKMSQFVSPRVSQLINEKKITRNEAEAIANKEWSETNEGKRREELLSQTQGQQASFFINEDGDYEIEYTNGRSVVIPKGEGAADKIREMGIKTDDGEIAGVVKENQNTLITPTLEKGATVDYNGKNAIVNGFKEKDGKVVYVNLTTEDGKTLQIREGQPGPGQDLLNNLNALEYDQENEVRISSQVGEGQKPIETQPIQGAGAETTETSGVLQAPEEVTPTTEAAPEEVAPQATTVSEVVEEKPTSETEGETTVTVGGTAAERMRQRRGKRKGTPVAETQEKPKEEKPKEEKPATGETKVSEVAPAVRPARAVEASEGSNPEAGEDSAFEAAGMTREERDEWKKNNKAQGKKPKIEQLTQAVKDLVSGKKSFKDYYRMAKELMPSKLMDKVPAAATFKEIIGAIDNNKLKIGIVGLNKFVKKGMRVGLRIDIPSFNNHGKNVVTVHDRSKSGQEVIGYGSTGSIKNVNFRTSVPTAAKIGTGETSKSAFAMAEGEWMDESPESIQKRAEEAMNSPEWVQVSMNPARNSFFFDKADGNPVVSADEVLQVGNLVLAKNPKKIDLNTAEGMAEFERMFSTTDKKTGVTYQYRTTQKTTPGEVKTGRKFTGRAAVNRVVDFLKKANIDVELVSDDRFKEVQKGTALTGSLDGLFFTDEKSGKIYLRESKVDTHFGDILAFHEGIHPVMNIVAKTNPKLYDAIHDGLQNLAKENSETGRAIRRVIETQKRFAEENGWGPSTLKDEIIVEALAIIAAKGLSIPQSQRGLRNAIIDFLNKIAKILNIPTKSRNVTDADFRAFVKKLSNAIREGGDIGDVVGERNAKKFENIISDGQASIDARIADKGVSVPRSEKLPLKIVASKEAEVMRKINELLDKYPKALTDREQWKELMSRVFPITVDGEVFIPAFPEGLSRMAGSVQETLKEIKKVSDEQRKLASEGLKGTKEIGELYKQGKMDEVDTGLYFLWNIMSIGISPYPQESGFLQAVNGGIDKYIKLAAKGEFTEKNLQEYLNWVDKVLPKGTPGAGSKSNLNSFGKSFLSKAAQIIETGEFKGKTKLQALHEILSDRKTPTNKLRRKWQANMSSMQFNNKIFDFILLTTGRSDLFVTDRVRVDHFWGGNNFKKERGLKDSTSLYDGSDLTYGATTGAGFSKILSDVPGLVFNELANRTMAPIVKKAYEKIGVKEYPEVGRFHWETWVAASSQEVSHGSIDAIVQRKEKGEIQDAGIRQGKYGAWDFNFSYKKRAGKDFVYEFVDNDGNTYVFDKISDIQDEIEKQKKKAYETNNRFLLPDAKGNISRPTKGLSNAWYDTEFVDSEKYFEFLRSKAKEVIPAPDIVEDQGVIIEKPKGQASVSQERDMEPSLVDEAGLTKNMTEDGKGNYVFYHKTNKPLKTIDPKFFGRTLATSRDERPGVGISMYYTRPDAGESMVTGQYGYIVRVPKDKVYPINEDPLNLYDEAKRMFEKDYPGQAFDANKQVGYITKLAGQKGFPMTVTKWQKGPLALRAQSTTALKPEVHYSPIPGYSNAIDINEEIDAIEPNEVKMRREKRRAKGSASYEREMESVLGYRGLPGEYDEDYNGVQYFAENEKYAGVFGKNIIKANISKGKILDLDKWNKKLKDAGIPDNGMGQPFLTIDQSMFDENKNFTTKGREGTFAKMKRAIGLDEFSKFREEFNNADVIYGEDAGNIGEMVYAVRDPKAISVARSAKGSASQESEMESASEQKSNFKPNKVFAGINTEISDAASEYKDQNGLSDQTPNFVISVSEQDGKKIADAYEKMQHDPNNPEVNQGFTELISEIKKQAEVLLSMGYSFQLSKEGEGYGSDSKKMADDVKRNKRIFVDPSSKAFGTKRTFDKDNMGLQDSGYKDVNGVPMTNVELIRAVHDLFGHAEFGNGFGAIGEENAWRNHMSMFTPLAQRALTTTTRGQNSWVNFGPNMRNKDGSIKKKGDEGYLSPAERPFAEQKIGFLPEWALENAYGDRVVVGGKTVVPTNKFISEGKEIYEINDAEAFYNAIASAKESRGLDGIQVTLKTKEEYQDVLDKGGRFLITKDGLSGMMIEADGNAGSGFVHNDVPKGQNTLKPMLLTAIKLGARYTDAYDTFLPKYYSKFGFKVLNRIPFNEEYAEEGWKETILSTKPDVVTMYWDGGSREKIDQNYDTFPPYDSSQGKVVDDYDLAIQETKAKSNEIEESASLVPPKIDQTTPKGTAKASIAQDRGMDPELAYNEVDRMIEDGENSGMNGQQMYDSISKTEAYASLSPEDRSLVNDTLRSMGAVTSDPAASSIMSYDAGEKAAVLDALRDNKDLAYIYRNFREILTDLKEKGIIETDCI